MNIFAVRERRAKSGEERRASSEERRTCAGRWENYKMINLL